MLASIFFHLLLGLLVIHFSNSNFSSSQELRTKNLWLQVVQVQSQTVEYAHTQLTSRKSDEKSSNKKVFVSNLEKTKSENYDEYFLELYRRVDEAKWFPSLSKKLGESGEVRIEALLMKSGKVHEVVLVSSSGFKRLDDAALDTVRSIDKIFPFPERIQADQLKIEIPLRYSL